jgi:hypothetical protein
MCNNSSSMLVRRCAQAENCSEGCPALSSEVLFIVHLALMKAALFKTKKPVMPSRNQHRHNTYYCELRPEYHWAGLW